MEWLLLLIGLIPFLILYLQFKEKKKIEKILDKKITRNEFKIHIKERQDKLKQENKTTTEIIKQDIEIQTQSEKETIELDIEEEYPEDTPYELIDMYERQEFDQMRQYLQMVASEMVGNRHSEEDKRIFKEYMIFFASRDPLYHDMMKELIVIIAKDEGIMQSKIYPYLPQYTTEIIRYVLYFAYELNDINRIKKGRSYQLFTVNYKPTIENKQKEILNIKYKEGVTYIWRDDIRVEADEVFHANGTIDLVRMINATDLKTHIVDRRQLLSRIVLISYGKRSKIKYRNILYKYAKIFISELPQYIKYDNRAGTDAIVKYITTLTENKEFEEAIKICNAMINLKLDDGTKSGFEGRIKRIQKKQYNT